MVYSQDLLELPEELQEEFPLYQQLLTTNPQKPSRVPSHNLKGDLTGYRALDIEWEGNPNAYRLVYRINEKPAPKRVLIVSFAEHNPAYDRAKERTGRD
nr:hypothetical protein [Argonema galeatum]